MKTEMWAFETARFKVIATIEPDQDADLSWADDEQLEAISSGRDEVFGALVTVYFEGIEIGAASIWGNVYSNPAEFFKERNGYFADLVSEAIGEARATFAKINATSLRRIA